MVKETEHRVNLEIKICVYTYMHEWASVTVCETHTHTRTHTHTHSARNSTKKNGLSFFFEKKEYMYLTGRRAPRATPGPRGCAGA